MDEMILPLGQHRLDPAPDFDPIRSLLRSLWIDTFWISERIASIAATVSNEPEEVRRELSYLRGDADDALQNLARVIELLVLGHTVDLGKRIGRGNSPPYFWEGVSMTPDEIRPVGQHELDPSPDADPVRFFLVAGKTLLVLLDERLFAFQKTWESDSVRAGQELREMQRMADQVRQHVARLIEVLLVGHTMDWSRSGPAKEPLRLFKSRSEADWLACCDLDSLCKMLRPRDYGVAIRFSERKWRLFGVACVRRVIHAFKDERTRNLVDVVERFADGLLTLEELKHHWGQARNPPNTDTEGPNEDCPPDERRARCAFQSLVAIPFGSADASRASDSAGWAQVAADQPSSEEQAQIALLHDVFGNPFRPALASPSWPTTTVVGLAQAIYHDRTFDRMPILGDALEEAGCTNTDILGHCRGPGPHVRGCWVVDLLLGKE